MVGAPPVGPFPAPYSRRVGRSTTLEIIPTDCQKATAPETTVVTIAIASFDFPSAFLHPPSSVYHRRRGPCFADHSPSTTLLSFARTCSANQTFAGYEAFKAKRLELMRDGIIDQRAFNQLIEYFMKSEDGPVFVAVNGAATFAQLSAYMFENDVAGFLRESGPQLFMHSVLTGS